MDSFACGPPNVHHFLTVVSSAAVERMSQLRNTTIYKECGDAFDVTYPRHCHASSVVPCLGVCVFGTGRSTTVHASEMLLDLKLPGQQVLAASVHPRDFAPPGWESFYCFE